MISYYPPTSHSGTQPGSINTSYHKFVYADVYPNFAGNLGILDWYSCLLASEDVYADLQHFIRSVDHVVVVSGEEFWPMHTTSRANAQLILDQLTDYSIIYHCGEHDRIQSLGVPCTYQPWFCRMPVTDYLYTPGERDYDFACLMGKTRVIRDRVADAMRDYNCLLNYIGRDHSLTDHNLNSETVAGYMHNDSNMPVVYSDQGSSIYQPGDNFDLSGVAPVDVYDQSHMDVIVETFPRNEFTDSVLLTEKTARSLAHGRLFRTLGHTGYLGELIRCGFEPYPIWRSNHDVGTQQDCFDSFISDLDEYSGNDFDMLYDECARELQHNKEVYQYLIKNYPNRIHKHFELIK